MWIESQAGATFQQGTLAVAFLLQRHAEIVMHKWSL